jgi:hypothetical protein
MEKPSTLLEGRARLPWSFNGGRSFSRLPHHHQETTLAKRIVQDNNPRKTKFTFEEAVDVWLRYLAGQFQHEIAAAYIINVRAVNHVLNEKTHVGSKQVAEARFNKSA